MKNKTETPETITIEGQAYKVMHEEVTRALSENLVGLKKVLRHDKIKRALWLRKLRGNKVFMVVQYTNNTYSPITSLP